MEGDLTATATIIAVEAGGTFAEWRDRFEAVLLDADRHFLVAEVDGEVVGFGHSRHVVRTAEEVSAAGPSGWYLSGVTVALAHRRCGVGMALTAARLARLPGVTVYYAAEPENEATIRLHQRFGFVRDGELTLPGGDRPLALFRRTPQSGASLPII